MTERVLSISEMRLAEKAAMQSGLNEDILIENAAAALCAEVSRRVKKEGRMAVFAGVGNNACDGLSLARMLLTCGYKCEVVTVSDKLSGGAAARLSAFSSLGGKTLSLFEAEQRADLYDVIIDAVFGIGLSRKVQGDFLKAIEIMNASPAKKIAVDIPSGLDADSGKALGTAVQADLTVTFGAYKQGHFFGDGRDYCGETVLCDIGVRADFGALLTGEKSPSLSPRKKVGHKGDYGRVRIMGGSPSMTGAPLISGLGAMRSGAGLTTLCVPSSMRAAYAGRVKEEMLMFMPDSDGYFIFDEDALGKMMSGADSIALGMGMGANPEIKKIVKFLCDNFGGNLILDADALNAFAGEPTALASHKAKLILTPHRGEFERLFGKTQEENIVSATLAAAEKLNAVIVNKSNTTVIACGVCGKVYINATGSPAQAKGGSGDFLAGAVAALSVRLGAFKGSARACYECGKAAGKAAAVLGENSVLASDLMP